MIDRSQESYEQFPNLWDQTFVREQDPRKWLDAIEWQYGTQISAPHT